MSGVDDIRLGWAALKEAAGATEGALSTHKLDVVAAGGPLFLAMDLSGAQHLLIPVVEEGPEDTQSEAVQIVNRRLGPSGKERFYADVSLATGGVGEVYDHLLADMLEQVSRKPQRPAAACITVLDRWRELLRPGRGGLGKQQLGGLFAELDLLAEFVRRDPRRRVDVWIGPGSTRHDFRRGSASLESKASQSTSARDTVIHGLDQLLPPEGGELHLAWTRLEAVPGGGRSVPDLVAELLSLGVQSHQLLTAVALAGSPPDLSELHGQITFEIRERLIYEVDEDFPRLTAKELLGGAPAPGVHDISYHLDLDQAKPLPPETVEHLMDAIATAEAT